MKQPTHQPPSYNDVQNMGAQNYNQYGGTNNQQQYAQGDAPPAGFVYNEQIPNEDGLENVNAEFSSFSDKSVRHAFIRKVYMIMTAQLLVTVGFVVLFQFCKPLQEWVHVNSWFYYLSFGVFFATYIALVCCPGVRRKFPGNFIALAIFTLALSYMTGTIASFYKTESVVIAAGITALVCLAISLFACQTKYDFTMCTGFIFVFTIVLLLFGITCMIVGPITSWQTRYILQTVYGALAALLFGLYLAYDTQMVVGGKRVELSPEEYIMGALQLYLDIVYMFTIILGFFRN